MAVNLQAVPGTGLVITPDNSGNMTFSTGLGSGNVAMTINAGNSAVSINTLTTTSNLTIGTLSFTDATQFNTAQSLGPRNKIINGAMQIAQRVSTNIQTGLTNGVFYIADRFYFQNATGATVSAQQSSTAPAGFNNSFYVTVTSSGTPGYGFIQQNIEGYNLADFALGTSSAKAFTVSFWVYSNLTGIYSVSIQTSTYDYSYNATYTINASNTWQYVILTIPGTALGTWYTDNRQGMAVRFSLINSPSGTPNAWVSTSQNGSTNNVNWFASNGNTFYLTGVQLEIGSVATPFERKLFDQILIDCQRYYAKSYDVNTVPGTATTLNMVGNSISGPSGAGNYVGAVLFPVIMRVAPTSLLWWDGAGNASKVSRLSSAGGTAFTNNAAANVNPFNIGTNGFYFYGDNSVANWSNFIHYTAFAEL